jgi:hypothetical protein
MSSDRKLTKPAVNKGVILNLLRKISSCLNRDLNRSCGNAFLSATMMLGPLFTRRGQEKRSTDHLRASQKQYDKES